MKINLITRIRFTRYTKDELRVIKLLGRERWSARGISRAMYKSTHPYFLGRIQRILSVQNVSLKYERDNYK